MKDLRYPIGEYVTQPYSVDLKDEWIGNIKFLPQAVENAIINLDEHQLQTPYREGGWTIHQLVHHLADSHMNAFCRFKLGFTEDNPTICIYKENLWANTADVQNVPINISITLLHSVHHRWHEFLTNLSEADWQRKLFHPEHNKQFTIWQLLGMYAWHSRHHVAHITSLRERMGW